MAATNGNDNITPESSDSAEFTPSSEPMIIDGKVVDPTSRPEVMPGNYANEPGIEPDAPPVLQRNGIANSAMFLGLAALLINPYGVTSLVAIAASIFGLRRAIAFYKETGNATGRLPATIGLALGVTTALFALWIYNQAA